jgi:hypothetical protein
MLTYEEELQSRSGCSDESVPCANCGHLDVEHDQANLRCFTCDCKRFNPVEFEDILADLDEVI